MKNVKNYDKQNNLGNYKTPYDIAVIMNDMLSQYINETTIILDNSCGNGGLIFNKDGKKFFPQNRYKLADIESNFLFTELNQEDDIDFIVDNSLWNVNREKYGIYKKEDVVIIGNPPFNMRTTRWQNLNFVDIRMDDDIKSYMVGLAFLNSYVKLYPKVICVIHPLSFLIKQKNFSQLKMLRSKYKLEKGLIFDSKLFGLTSFPLMIGLYTIGEMNYFHIKTFEFDILNLEEKFVLSSFQTIDNYIKKNSQDSKSKDRESPYGIYAYQIRDNNFLTHTYNITFQVGLNTIPIFGEVDLYKYLYVWCHKKFFNPKYKYLYANLSPLINRRYFDDPNFLASILKTYLHYNKEIPDYAKKYIKDVYDRSLKNCVNEENIIIFNKENFILEAGLYEV